jgi:hypothetical protein
MTRGGVVLRLKNEEELQKLGLALNQLDRTQVIPLDRVPIPNSGQSLDELARQVRAFLDQSRALNGEAASLQRRSTVQLFFAGMALRYAKEQAIRLGIPWQKWLKDNGIPLRTADEAMQLASRAKTVESIKDLRPTEAKRKFGIYPPKRVPTRHDKPIRPTNGRPLKGITKKPQAGKTTDPRSAGEILAEFAVAHGWNHDKQRQSPRPPYGGRGLSLPFSQLSQQRANNKRRIETIIPKNPPVFRR